MDTFTITGKVIPGKGYGKKLGFPTANLSYPENISGAIKDGVYGGYVTLKGNTYRTAFCVGTQPMYNVTNVEVHFVDTKLDDLTGQEITVRDITFIRQMEKFNTDAELIAAINNDVQYVRKHL